MVEHKTTSSADTLRHLVNIQALRALAVFLVVGVHLQFNEARASAEGVLPSWFYHGVSGVDLFFIISGFIMVYICAGTFGQAGQSRVFLLYRAARIYPPAILFTALAILGMFVAGTTQKWLPGNNILFSFLLLPQTLPPLLGVSWTLLHEVYFYLIFSVFLLTGLHRLAGWLLLWGGIVLIAQWTGLWPLNPWTLLAFHPLTFEFILGALIGLLVVYRPDVKPFIAGLSFAVGGLLFIAGMVWIDLQGIQNYPTGWGRVIAFSPGAAMIVYGAYGLEASGVWRAPAFISILGDWSYSLYLSHILVISALAQGFGRIDQPGMADNIGFILIALLAVLVVSALSFYGFERPTLRWLKRGIRRYFLPKKAHGDAA